MVTIFYASALLEDGHTETFFFKSREVFDQVSELTEDYGSTFILGSLRHFTVPDYGNIDFATPEDFQ